MKKAKKIGITEIVLVGVFAALVYAAHWIRLPIETPVDRTAIHLGNILCLLSGFVLGPLWGGMAAGLGPMLFDMTYPGYFASWPFTLVFKFIMGFLCGLIGSRTRVSAGFDLASKITAAAAGQLAYVFLYLGKGIVWDGMLVAGLVPKAAFVRTMTANALPSVINALIAVAISAPLALALQKALKNVPLYRNFAGRRNL